MLANVTKTFSGSVTLRDLTHNSCPSTISTSMIRMVARCLRVGFPLIFLHRWQHILSKVVHVDDL